MLVDKNCYPSANIPCFFPVMVGISNVDQSLWATWATSVRKRPVRSGLGLGRPAWAFFVASFQGISDRAWPDFRDLQAFG